ncbi:MAG: DNA primase [Leptospirales bacterium]|nr:DNA primase [Leptospirales bacterium]
MLEQNIIDKIRNSVRLEDIAARYIPSLKKTGKNYKGLCPFHKEKTPSFTITPDKQLFYCFGCNVSGNIFTFISKIENIGFMESVKKVADIAGIDIKIENDESSERNTIRRINKYAMNFYQSYLLSNNGLSGKQYLIERGITEESIDLFKLGFSPNSWDRLAANLIKNNADIDLSIKIGLIGRSEKYKRSYFDKFRNRVIFPIFDRSNNVIAFGARVISDADKPKYLNSSESEIFKKRDVLYGLNFAQNSIRELDRAIVVEGYLDVIGCHKYGITNTVAPLGTALTENHIKILSQLCNELVFLFDPDSAGINAALRSIDTSKLFNVKVKIATLPHDDPFDFIKKHGPREFMAIIDSAEKPVDFKIRNVLKRNSNRDKIDILKELFVIIKNISYSEDENRPIEAEQGAYLIKISQMLNIDEEAIRSDYKRFIKGEKNNVEEKSQNNEAIDYETRAYRDLIHLIVHYPEIIDDVLIDFSFGEIKDDLTKSVLSAILKLYNSENELRIDKIFDFLSKDMEMDFLNRTIQREASVEDPKAAYTEIYVNLRLHNIDKKINEYINMVKKSGNERVDYLTDIEVLRREKEKLSTYLYNR